MTFYYTARGSECDGRCDSFLGNYYIAEGLNLLILARGYELVSEGEESYNGLISDEAGPQADLQAWFTAATRVFMLEKQMLKAKKMNDISKVL